MTFSEGVYYISTSLGSHKAIDLEASKATGRIIEYKTHNGKNQQWRVTSITHDEYSIQSVATNTYITAPSDGNDATARASKLMPECNSVTRWKITKSSSKNNSHVIHNVAYPSKVLDVSGSEEADLTPILVYDFHGGENQQFTFKEV
ncbi:carbohydrate-binding module family 13 protein [Trichoderma chlorosporum]